MFDLLTKPNPKELQRLQLFHAVPLESIEGILDSCVIKRLKRGELLFTPGQPNRNLFQVLSGCLRVHLDSLRDEPVSMIEAGETVGEMSIIDNSLTSAFVVAHEDSRLLVLERDLVWSLVEFSHAAAYNLLKILSQRLRHANNLITEKLQMEDSFCSFGNIDVVTGMHNRQWLNLVLPRQINRSTMSGRPLSLILLDIDSFRQFNDKHGRLCGDVAINKIAHAIMEHMRPTELAVRYGGDEILVLIPDVDLKVARSVAERIRQRIMYMDIASPDGRKLPSLTISLGIAQAEAGQSAEELLGVVEAALARAKDMGRNFVSA
jgi:diguanylate cyclase (GGDEF)-like protein